MALPPIKPIKHNGWPLTITRLFMGAALLLATVYLGRLVDVNSAQSKERRCLNMLNVETDRIDSEIAATQADIFQSAILAPINTNAPSEELLRLGEQMRELLEDRTEAYERRDNSAERCE